MKNLTDKSSRLKSLATYLLTFAILFFSNCKKDDDSPSNCGCNSDILSIIPETAELTGTISYKEQTQSNSYYTNKYWVTYTYSNCSNCVRHMIVCNESFITNDILDVLNTQPEASVKFAGELREVCKKRFDLADITYERITLTKIELQ